MYPFFAIGWLAKECTLIERLVYGKWIVGVISLITYMVGCIMVKNTWFGYSLNLNVWESSFKNEHLYYWAFLLIMGLAGVIFLFWGGHLIIYRLKQTRIAHIINVGRYTLAIYLIQGVIFNAILTKYDVNLNSQLMYFLVSVVLLEIIYGAIMLFERNKYTAFLLLGKKLA